MTHPPALQRALRLLASAWLALGATAQGGRAPDGQPGLGEAFELSELLDRMRATKDEEQDWLAGLEALGGEVGLLFATAAEEYRSRGYFALLEPEAALDLATLHAAWREAAADPEPLLAQGGVRGRALAGMLLDPRFRVRAWLHEDFETERREVRTGLAVLRGAATSFVTLSIDEARAIAQRVDVSAARLRAARSDLMALRGSAMARHEPLAKDPAVTALLAAARTEDPAARRSALADGLGKADQRVTLMRSALFSERLMPAVEAHLEWRKRLLAEAAVRRAEARVYLPGTPESQEAPVEIQRLKKHERIRWAGYSARAGLVADPLDDELAFVAARAADFQWGDLEARPLYDRFLFLRGIHHFDHRTLRDRRLDAWETEALDAVQRPMSYERPTEAGGLRD
jgi:anti-sigma factor ChrR (cupin superfamily)